MISRRILLANALCMIVAPLAAGQPTVKSARIGMLRSVDDPSPSGPLAQNVAAFKQGLAEDGYVEGRNLVIEYRSPRTTTDRLEDVARELVRLNVDVIHAAGPQALHAARTATGTIPILAHDFETDPIAAGFIASYARPGGNVTGMFLDLPELTGKWLELLRRVAPRLKQVAVLWDPATGEAQRRATEVGAHAIGVTLQILEVRYRGELEARLQHAADARAGAMVVLSSPLFAGPADKLIADLALRTRLPSISLFLSHPKEGGLLAYGPNSTALYRQDAHVVAKILNGARPGGLPIERPARFELLVNLRTAKRLGLTVPSDVLGRADQVLE